jgi:ABC-type phosphate transport system auxiliary subunit
MMITPEDLLEITEHIHGQFNQWLNSSQISANIQNYELKYTERLVRVEESIKNSIELTQQGFNLMEKRFEQVDKRFEQVDKRFEQVDKRFETMQSSIDKRFEHVETKLTELSRRMFQFMIWSFGFTATSAGIIIAVLKF